METFPTISQLSNKGGRTPTLADVMPKFVRCHHSLYDSYKGREQSEEEARGSNTRSGNVMMKDKFPLEAARTQKLKLYMLG